MNNDKKLVLNKKCNKEDYRTINDVEECRLAEIVDVGKGKYDR